MRMASATHQGGHLMARTTPAGESWSAWLIPKLIARDWRDPGPNPRRTGAAMLIAAVGEVGADVARQTVSKWLKAENAADPNLAVAVATALDADPVEALRAADYGPIADIIIDLLRGRPSRPAGARSDTATEIIAEAIQEIFDDDDLTPVEQRDYLEHLRRRVNSVVAEVRGARGAISASRDEVDSA